MLRIKKDKMILAITLTIILVFVLAPTAWVLGDAPHNVQFSTNGLPGGVSITITGTRTNPGGHAPVAYSNTFTSPGPSTSVTTEPGTTFTYTGFPSPVDVGGQSYSLASVTPASGFTTGASGGITTVTAVYGPSCEPPAVTDHPDGATVTVGDPVTFTVSASGTMPLSYQWRKDGIDIPGATNSSYLIASVHSSDAGSYDVVVSNTCSQTTATSDPAVLTVNKADQTITVTTPAPTSAVYNTSFTVAATASSGLPVAYSASGDCTNVGATFTMTSGTGTCTVYYNQAGDDDYNAAPEVTEDVTAQKADQTITVTTHAPANAPYNDDFSVAATASSGLSVAYSASGACTNVGATFTMTSSTGTCTVHYNQAGDANYNAAPEVTEDVTAQKADQTITFDQPPSPVLVGTTFTVNPTASSGLAVSLAATGSCTNVGFQVTMTNGTGVCTLTASQAGDANYNPALDVVRLVQAFQHYIYLPIVSR